MTISPDWNIRSPRNRYHFKAEVLIYHIMNIKLNFHFCLQERPFDVSIQICVCSVAIVLVYLSIPI